MERALIQKKGLRLKCGTLPKRAGGKLKRLLLGVAPTPTTNKLRSFQLPSQLQSVDNSTDQPGLPNLNTPPLPRGRLGHGKGYVAPRWAAPTPDVRRLFTLLFSRHL